MGVPKFYRWISERYPCLSEVVKEYQIPEFDNLYLDMNGIIHVCSHPNDNDPHFRITEEKIFKDIFHYIEVLFRLIQPREVFFMAVDGVAPRAKMNQQRGRRFRSANEAIEAEKKAKAMGEVLPSEERFDSNCITPGTAFMARLDAQLQYFITSKISQDRLWQNCKVIYSGHQSQPHYNPNTRHCLYGLDADLIMLGLTSHEPHFSLLREEVRFGGKKDSNRRTPTAEETTFHLLHLSLMREYVNYEFWELHKSLSFGYDLENIIDDWVLMGFLVGNDFIPHLPHLHINKEALPILYRTYKDVMPELDGYLNDGGKLHLGRFEKFMAKLSEFDVEQFHEQNADLKYFQSKKLKDGNAFKVNKSNGNREIELETFNFDEDDGFEEGGAFGALEAPEDDDDDVEDLCKTYEKLGYNPDPTFLDCDEEESSESEESIFNAEFRQHKREYYMTKMHFMHVNSEVLHEQATSYVRGIQWILNYYYNGICSWSWYYPYHYSPYISDIKNFANMEMNFEMGKPFLPYQQLLAVLPPLSKNHLPRAYQGLMLKENSPLKEFYPDSFKTDLNGKQQDWEAVVLIPFIDEKLLLEAMNPCNEDLTEEEKSRNIHGPMYIYTYTSDNLGECKSPGFFLSVSINHAKLECVKREDWEMLPEKIYKGLCRDVKQDVYFAGFPSLKHIDHKFHIAKDGVKVFQQNSRGENFILDVTESKHVPDLKDLANQLLGKVVFVSWPHLMEAKVEAMCDKSEYYSLVRGEVQKTMMEGHLREEYSLNKNSLTSHYHDRWGVEIGNTSILVYAAPLTGRKYAPSPSGRMSLEKEWSRNVQPYAYQTIVKDIAVHDPGYKQHLAPEEYFPPRTKVFMLGHPYYGCMGEVIEIDPSHKGRIRVAMTVASDPNFEVVKQRQGQLVDRYMTGYFASQRIGMSSHILARLTGTVFLVPPSGGNLMAEMEMKNKLNIGLNLKSNKRNEEVCGYSRRTQDGANDRPTWLYSEKAIDALGEYQKKFPEIFDHLTAHAGQKDIFYQDEVFGTEKYKERVAELTDWLKNSDFAKAERQPCGTQTLDEAIVSRLIEELDKVSMIRAKVVKMQVRPHLLFKPNPLQGSTPPDHTVSFKMFDRVINVREAFAGGLTLRGPSSAHRCYRLHWAALVNITHGNRSKSASGPSMQQSRVPQHDAWNKQQYNNDSQNHRNNLQYPGPVRWQQSRTQEGNVTEHLRQNNRTKAPYQGRTPQARAQPHTSHTQQPNKTNNPTSPQPPDPQQLPSPSGLRVNHKHRQGDTNGDVGKRKVHPRWQNEGKLVAINSPDEVNVVIHGTYYAAWSQIYKQGLVAGRGLIPCYSYVPWDINSQLVFQLYVFLDVRKAMSDGMTFFRDKGKQILCTGDSQGIINRSYFSKVVDCISGEVIFPSQPAVGPEALPSRSPGNQQQQPQLQQGQGQRPQLVLDGRGNVVTTSSQEPQKLQIFESIWSKAQAVNPDSVDLRPMQSQMLSQLLNISGDVHPASPQQVKGPTLPPQSSQDLASSRMEVSVQDIFKGALGQNQLHVGPQSQAMLKCEQSEPVVIGTALLGAAETSHSVTQPPERYQKAGSPSKSAFVPTQVIRNQTPRKPKADHFANYSGRQESSTNYHYSQQQQQQHQQSQPSQHQYQHNSRPEGASNKPKRQTRNRLAVKFDKPPGKNY
ncbi:5'-3' exoribonuclease 1-like [Homarus americanus]|uniref:5'-3' exoribonuclease 1-like n=1 Tax=Homarus americanus TaxID=6706 RepID=A0A8J5K435_HOMAM|nr:5'-3' exoribonuclease 1-like [Homarus americanus]